MNTNVEEFCENSHYIQPAICNENNPPGEMTVIIPPPLPETGSEIFFEVMGYGIGFAVLGTAIIVAVAVWQRRKKNQEQ